MSDKKEAILSSENNYTIFQFDNHIIRFKAPYSLERYTKIKEWDHGYLVATGASVVAARRGGLSATFDELNKYFTICGMPVASSQYWNSGQREVRPA